MLLATLFATAAALRSVRISGPDVPLTYASLQLSSFSAAISGISDESSLWISAWVRSTALKTPLVRLETEMPPAERLLVVWILGGSLEVKIGSGETNTFPLLGDVSDTWKHLFISLPHANQLWICTGEAGAAPQCSSLFSSGLSTRIVPGLWIVFGCSGEENKSVEDSTLLLDLKLLVTEHSDPASLSESSLSSSGTQDRKITSQDDSLTTSLLRVKLESAQTGFALSGWVFLRGDSQLLLTVTGDSETVTVRQTEGEVQVCVRREDHIFCTPSLAAQTRWHFLSVSYFSGVLGVCLGTLWTATATCMQNDIRAVLGESEAYFSSADFGSERACLQLFALVLDTSPVTTDTANTALEKWEEVCVVDCPLRRLASACHGESSVRHDHRELGITHYSAITYRQYMPWHGNHYFTFVNNHAATVYISFVGDNLGGGGDPDIFISKPWSGGGYDWYNEDWLTSAFTLYPSDSKLPSKGGINGLYTMRIYGWNGPFTYECRIRIACASSLTACNCASGTYPNIYTSSCSACPGGVNACVVSGNLGCLPYSASSTAPTNTFNCQTCNNAGTTLDITTGNCVNCASVCASCQGTGAAQCVTCKTGASLTGSIGSSTCSCVPGYFPNTTAANCSLCSTTCATCVSAAASACQSCKSNASLAAAPPNSCVCNSGYGGSASNCQPCHVTCLTCSLTVATSCTSCKTVAVLGGTAPNSCVCPAGYFPNTDSSNCSPCDVHCAKCTGALDSQCTSCKANAYRVVTTSPSACTCVDGYYGDSASCQQCDSTCGKCLSGGPSQCTTCKSGATLVGTSPNNCQCSAGFFPSTTPANCQACHATCATCISASPASCLSCKANASLTSGVCACASHYFPNVTAANCVVCDSTCKECLTVASTKCTACYSNAALVGGTNPAACGCSPGFVPTPGVSNCQPCDGSCLTCSTGGTSGCTSCYPHAKLSGAKPSSCVCLTGMYPNPTSASCQPCDRSCLTCSGPLSTECVTCNTSATLSIVGTSKTCTCGTPCYICDATCLSCDGNGPSYCTTCFASAAKSPPGASSYCECSDGNFPSPSAASCQVCDVACKHCTVNAAASCTECYSNAALQDGLNPSSCVCVQGFYPNPSPKTCGSCDQTCTTCTGGGASNCSGCYQNANLSSGSCICDPGYYPNTTSKTCSTCDDACLTCLAGTANDCKTCFTRAVRSNSTASSSSCICDVGNYADPDVANCKACHVTCKYCVGNTDVECNQCYSNAVLENGVSPGKCICLSNAFTLTNASNCVMCEPTCLTCGNYGAALCTSCYPNAHLTSPPTSACACDATFLPIPTVASCISCDKTCKSCSNSGTNFCTSCYPNAQLHNALNPSYCECTPAFYPAPTPANCDSCFIACQDCSGEGEFECTACFLNASLKDSITPNSCECSPGYYPNPTAKTCSLCDTTCLRCTGGLPTLCADCYPNALLSNGIPSQCDCQSQYIRLPGSSSCIQCDLTCDNCAGSGQFMCTTCFPDAHLLGASPNKCVCDDSFYPNTTPANCEACDESCFQCVGPAPSQCTACFPPAALEESISPGTCICLDGYYPAPTPRNCLLCAETCRKCVGNGALDCYRCYEHAVVEGGFPLNHCVCDVGFYPNPTSSKCAPCHNTCLECVGKAVNDCSVCKSFGRLSGSPSGVCDCQDGAYPSPDSSNCQPCDPTCLTCSAGDAASCNSCGDRAYLTGPSPSSCACSPAFFHSSEGCQPCHPSCATCIEAVDCLSCRANAVLSGAKCECAEGFVGSPDASNCQSCSIGCILCIEGFCEKCKEGFFYFRGECLTKCPQYYRPNLASECEEIDLRPPEPSLTVTPTNGLIVDFSRPMQLFTLTASDIVVSVVDPDQADIGVAWGDPSFDGVCSLSIGLSFEVTYLPPECQATLVFVSPGKVADTDGISIEVTSLTGVLFESGNAPVNSTVLDSPMGLSTAAMSSGAAVSSTATSIVNGNPGVLTSFVNQMQLMSYMGMTKVPLPTDFAATLAALNMGFALSGPFSSKLQNSAESQKASSHVFSYGIESTQFLTNAITILCTSASLLLSYIPAYLLSKVSNKRVSAYFKGIVPSIMWNTPMTIWMTSYLDIGVFSFLQLTNARNSLHDAGEVFNLVLALLFGLGVLATPFLVWSFVHRNFQTLTTRSDANFTRRWGSLLSEFRSGDASCIVFYLIFTTRRALFLLSLTLIPDYPGIITIFNSFLSASTLGYLVTSSPFLLRVDQVTAVANEGAVLLVYLSVCAFVYELSSTSAAVISAAGIWVARSTIFLNLCISLYRSGLLVLKVITLYCKTAKITSAREFAAVPSRAKRTLI